MVAESSVLVATVIGVARRGVDLWAYLDVGGFNGLMEALQTGGRWLFPIRTSRPDDHVAKPALFNVTGPSCDSSDTMFYGAELPETLDGRRSPLHRLDRRLHVELRLARSTAFRRRRRSSCRAGCSAPSSPSARRSPLEPARCCRRSGAPPADAIGMRRLARHVVTSPDVSARHLARRVRIRSHCGGREAVGAVRRGGHPLHRGRFHCGPRRLGRCTSTCASPPSWR